MNDLILNKFKEKIRASSCLGIFSKTLDSNFIEAAGISGLDFIILDMEHGAVSIDRIHDHVRACVVSQTMPIVRVSSNDHQAIGSVLDAGALGVQVPNITTAVEARSAIEAAKYHPKGMRGVCRFVRAANFGSLDKAGYFDKANETLVILQVEGIEGIANLDEILDVEGVDVLFIGPYDLSQSVGKPGQVESEEVQRLMKEISLKAKAKGVLLGAFSDNQDNSKALLREGFNYLAYSVDVNIFQDKLRELLEDLT